MSDSTQETTFQIEATASSGQAASRNRIRELYAETPIGTDDVLMNIGLYARSSVLAKIITLSDLYRRVCHLPGVMIELGTWWGQNLVLLENFRAIYEPFNKQRTIVGFDTFLGYTPTGSNDRESAVWGKGSYTTGAQYKSYLEQLVRAHEGSNVLGHLEGRHKLVAGDVTETVPKFFAQHPESLVAFAYFDLGLYEPTKAALAAMKPHLLSGSILLMDELTWSESPGEAIAFREVFDRSEFTVEKAPLFPSKSIVMIK